MRGDAGPPGANFKLHKTREFSDGFHQRARFRIHFAFCTAPLQSLANLLSQAVTCNGTG
jgi:hypothetical protein